MIYPRVASDNNFIRAGETRRIPDNTRFRMRPPYGEELILVAAYERPFELNQPSSGAGTLSSEVIARGLEVEEAESSSHKTMSPSVTAKFSYTILP